MKNELHRSELFGSFDDKRFLTTRFKGGRGAKKEGAPFEIPPLIYLVRK
jgi:hypothetical protein